LEEDLRDEISAEARDLVAWVLTWTSIWRVSVEVSREAYAEVEAELEETARTQFEVIAVPSEEEAEEANRTAARFAMTFWDHCHEEEVWEEYHGEEAAEEGCREVEEVVVLLLNLMTRNPNSILPDHHAQNYQDHCFREPQGNPYPDSGTDPMPMLQSRHQ
jgi:hypothetical protein